MSTSANWPVAVILLAILVIIYRTKPILALWRGFDESSPFMKFERNPVINDQVRVSTSANRQAAAILSAILVIVRQTKSIFELGWEFDGSDLFMKLWRNQVKKWLSQSVHKRGQPDGWTSWKKIKLQHSWQDPNECISQNMQLMVLNWTYI